MLLNKDKLKTHPADSDHIAIVNGQAVEQLPSDLYIPPQALKVFLQSFEGPLDLLLYLIRYKDLSILEIPIFEISNQYIQYIELMSELELELAGEYLLMAATLAEIKSRMLLPKVVTDEGVEEDPRADLVRRLQEYEQIKNAAETLETLPQIGRDFLAGHAYSNRVIVMPPIETSIALLCKAYQEVLLRVEQYNPHQFISEPLSVRERMSLILDKLQQSSGKVSFSELIDQEEGRAGVVVTFLATLDLIKSLAINVYQVKPFECIYLSMKQN